VFRIITVIAITSARSPSLRSRSVTCRTRRTPTLRSPQFNVVKANGPNQQRISKSPHHSIQRTQTFFLTLLSTTWLSATSRLLKRFLIRALSHNHSHLVCAE